MREELCEYLSHEYMKCVKEEEELVQQKYSLQAKQSKAEKNLYFHAEEEKNRQLFSPLVLHGYDYSKELTQENLQLNDAGNQLQACEEKLAKLNEKKKKLKEFMSAFREMPEKKEEETEKAEEERVPFFPAFYELAEHTRWSLPETEFLYDEEEMDQEIWMTFAFLTGWKKLFRYILGNMTISDILFRTVVEEKAKLVLECVSDTSLKQEEKQALEQQLSKGYSVHEWKEDSFEIHITLE